MVDVTSNLRLNKPVFNSPLWHDQVNDNWEVIDATITTYLTITNIQGVWENSTAYATGEKAIDVETSTVYECVVAHTSAASPTTFAEDRSANPAYWQAPAIAARGLGSWTPTTPYEPNDFVIGTGNIFAVCIASHTSSSDFATDVVYWDYLLDLSTIQSLPAITGADALKYLRVNGGATQAEWVAASQISTDLGLGTMSTQAANNVNITGGAITGANLDNATDTAEGVVELATQTEVHTGSDTTRVITPATLTGRAKFYAHKNAVGQTATSGVDTSITWSTEGYDIGGFFASNAWTPPAGYVRISCGISIDGTNGVDAELLVLRVMKNGSQYRSTFTRRSGTGSHGLVITMTDLANGSDAYSIAFQKNGAGNGNIQGDTANSWFEGECL